MSIIGSVLSRHFGVQKETLVIPLRNVQAHFNELVLRHVKKSHANNTYRYSLDIFDLREPGRYATHPGIYWENEFGFVLCAQEVPIAVVGFEKKSTYLFIQQMQGVKGAREYLLPLRWEQLLYRIVILFGRKIGVREIRVLPSFRSIYHPFRNDQAVGNLSLGECYARAKRLRRIYDEESQRCGFKLGERIHTYTMSLSQ